MERQRNDRQVHLLVGPSIETTATFRPSSMPSMSTLMIRCLSSGYIRSFRLHSSSLCTNVPMCLFLGLSMAELSRRLAGCSKTPICCVSLILPRVKHGAGLLRRTSKYVSLLGISGALHLGIFEQPAKNDFFSNRLERRK